MKEPSASYLVKSWCSVSSQRLFTKMLGAGSEKKLMEMILKETPF